MQNDQKWKYATPQLHNVLRREKILSILEERSRRKFILIHARAGQGKSVVMADYLNRGGHDSLWFRLDDSEGSPSALIAELDRGLATLDGGKPSPPQKKEKDWEPALERLIARMNGIGGRCTYLILDDFEMVGASREIGSVIEILVDRLPENLRLAILTRELPSMSLARARLLQNLIEIRDADLAVNDVEATELIKDVFHLDIPRDLAVSINHKVEGWVTGIILLLEQLSAQEDEAGARDMIQTFLGGGIHPDFTAFFNEEVFTYVNGDCEKQLVKLGAFPAFPRELAEDILGTDAEEMLQTAADKGLFLSRAPRDDVFDWNFNPVFSEYLSNRFDALPADEQELALRTASRRFMDLEMIDQALPCLVRAGLFEEARKHFIDYAEELILGNKHLKIRNLLAVFPDLMRKKDQYLEFYGLVSDTLFHPFATKKKLLKLLPFFESLGDENRQATIYTVLLQNYFFYQENLEAVESISRLTAKFLERSGHSLDSRKRQLLEALLPLGEGWTSKDDDSIFDAAMRAEETSIQLRDSASYLCSRLVLARKYLNRGDFSSARRLLEKTMESFGEDRYGRPYVSLISFYLGDVLFYSGNIHAAIREVQDGLNNSSPDFAFRPYLEVNLVLYNLYLQKFRNAEPLLEAMREREMGDNLYLRYFTAYHLQMLLAYRNNNRRRAAFFCKRLLEPENGSLLEMDYPYSMIALLETAIWLEEDGIVGTLLEKLSDEIDAESHPFSAATFAALEAYYLHKSGKAALVIEPAERALSLMKKHAYENLDICKPEVLYEITKILSRDPSETFPRIKSLAATQEFVKNSAQLEIRTLGTFRIFASGEEIPIGGMISKKRVADLLKLLIIHRESGVRKELIYDLFWPKYSAKNARDNLNTIFYRLRNILGKDREFFEADSTKIGFREGILDTDVDRFIQSVKAGEALESQGESGPSIEMYSQAIDTYAGDFLAGDLYSDSIRDERQGLLQRYINTLFRLSLLYLGGADYLQALDSLRKLLDKDPLCEPAVRLLMITSALLGSRNRIPQILDDLGQRLMESYELEPDELTIALKDRLLSGEKPGPAMWKNEVIVS